MLENANIIIGNEDTEFNELCGLYNKLSLQIKDLTSTKDGVSKKLKTICNFAGIFESSDYCVKMVQTKDTMKLDTEKIEKYLQEFHQEIYKEVLENCMKETKGYLKFGSVTYKGEK